MFYNILNQLAAGREKWLRRTAVPGLLACAGLLALAAPGAYADTWTLTTVHTFRMTDGASPEGALVQDADGNLYGTTYIGGAHTDGVVYKITPDGTFTVIYSFRDAPAGYLPEGSMVLGDDGNLYGTTSQGGSGTIPSGTIFKMMPDGTLTSLHSFCSNFDDPYCTDGQIPRVPLTKGSDGNYYGTTTGGGGPAGAGAFFKITPDGDFTLLGSFPTGAMARPNGGLIEGTDGNFYGTSRGGSDPASSSGTVFKITPAGVYTSLHTFTGGADGRDPKTGLLLASDGNFYGTTTGGADGYGTVFKITPSGTLTTLHVFADTDGYNVPAPLIEASDGNFYGVASQGGEHGFGTIFRITPAGAFTVLYSFEAVSGNGIGPQGALLETADGAFYGTTGSGGAGPDLAFGTVFKFSSAGAAPSAPKSFRAVAGDGSVDLSWAAVSGADSYNLYQGVKAGGEAATPVTTGVTKAHTTIQGLTNGTTYYFTVAAVNDAGVGKHSDEVHAAPLAASGKVTGLKASAGDGKVTLSWKAVSGATGYTVNQGTAAGKEKPVATGVTDASYTASSLTNGTRYYFTVVATNTAGSGPASAEVNATPVKSTPTSDSGEDDPGNAVPAAGNSDSGGGGPLSPVLLPLLGLLLLWSRRQRPDGA